MIAIALAFGVAIGLVLAMLRLFAGPTLQDRALAAKTVIIRIALICAAVAVAAGRSEWLDVAIALLLGAFVVMIAVLKVFRVRTFQAPLSRSVEEA